MAGKSPRASSHSQDQAEFELEVGRFLMS